MKEETIKLSSLQELFKNKQKYFLNQKTTHTGIPDGSEGNQGDYNEYSKFYRHPDMPQNIFLMETYQTDSYGYNDSLQSIEFVQGREKTITVFEPIF